MIAQGLQVLNLANGTERNHEPGERVSAAIVVSNADPRMTLSLLGDAAAHGVEGAIPQFRYHLAELECRAGNWDAAMEHARESRAAAQRIRIQKELAESHEGLRFEVTQAEHGSLPRFELKAKRVLDERIVIGTEGERRQA